MTDIANDLRERFDYAAYFYLSAWEHDPEMFIDGNVIARDEAKSDFEDQMIDTFEKLRDSVDAISPAIIAKADELRTSVGQEEIRRACSQRDSECWMHVTAKGCDRIS